MRIDMEDWEGVKAHAHYGHIHIASETDEYRLTIGDFLGGVGGDGMSWVTGQNFTTEYADNDVWFMYNCARTYPSGFWLNDCLKANPNGNYQHTSASAGYARGIIWSTWRGYYKSLKFTEMKLRPAL